MVCNIHLDSRGEQMIERQLRSGRYQSAEEVVVSALEALDHDLPTPAQPEQRCKAVQEMLEFAGKHGFTLEHGASLRDLIHEGHKY